MKKFFKSVILSAALLVAPLTAAAQGWTPPGPISLIIGFAAGGGADTQARLVAAAIEDSTGWTILPEQVTGNSGLNAVLALKDAPADGTAIAMIVSETLGYNAVREGNSDLQHDKFTALATTGAFQTGLVAMAEGNFASWDAVTSAAAESKPIRFGVATERQADVAYHLGQQVGIDFNIVSVQGGAGIMNGLRAGDLDIGWVAGAQTGPVTNGEMVNIASAIGEPLAASPDAPMITDLGSKFMLDGYFMFIGPAEMPDAARDALSQAISDAVTSPDTEAHALVTKAFGGASVLMSDNLSSYLATAAEGSVQLLEAVK